MNIVLKSLDLVHFKCFPKLHLDFHEGVNNIYGENAAGKTSVYDSLTVAAVQQGQRRKRAAGHQAARAHRRAPCPRSPRFLSWTASRSSCARCCVRSGNARAAAPSSATQVTRATTTSTMCRLRRASTSAVLRKLIDENRFKLLTDVWAVTSKMHWKDPPRAACRNRGLPEDRELLATAPQFAELNEKVGRRTVDEFKAVLAKQRKDMNVNLNTLPVRVDECSRMVGELESLDFAAAHAESDRLQTERERLQGEIVKLSNNTLAAQAHNERDALQVQLRELEAENAAHLASQRVPVEDETPALTAAA